MSLCSGQFPQSHSSKPRAWLPWLLVALAIWGMTDVRDRGRPHLHNRLKHRTDLTVYTEAGSAFFDGRPPYEVSNPRGWRYLYPPLFAMLLAPLHFLPSEDQVVVWFAVSLLACWGCYRELKQIWSVFLQRDSRLGELCRRWLPWLGAAALVAGLFPTLNCLQRGQVGIVMLYLLLLGFRLTVQGRGYRIWIVGGIVLAMPVALKVLPLLPVGVLLLQQWASSRQKPSEEETCRVRPKHRLAGSTLGVTLGLVLFFLVIPAALVGWQANLRHLDDWLEQVVPRHGQTGVAQLTGLEEHTLRNQSLSNALYRLGSFLDHVLGDGPDDRLIQRTDAPRVAMDAPVVQTVLFWLRLILLAALAATAVTLGREADALSQAAGVALACVAMLVLSPIARGHYFMFLIPGAIWLPLWLARRNMCRAAALMAAVPAALSLLHYIFLHQVGRVGLLGLGSTLWLGAAMMLVAGAGRAASRQRLPSVEVIASDCPPVEQAA